jgi:hypothetical protein
MIVTDVDEVESVESEIILKEGGKPITAEVMEEFEGKDVILRIAMEYSKYNGQIREQKVVKGVFRASDKASADEILNGKEPGKQYAIEEKYTLPIYKDVDEDEVKEWIAKGRPKASNGNKTTGTKKTFKSKFKK